MALWTSCAPYVLDVLALGLFGLLVWIGYKRGFFKTIMRLISLGVSLAAATVLSRPAATLIYRLFVQKWAADLIETNVTATENTITAGVDATLAELPAFLKNLLSSEGLGSASAVLERAGVSAQAAPAEVSEAVLQKVVEPLAVTLLTGMCFMVLLVLCLIAMLLLTRAVDLAAKLPVLKQINGGLGIVVGIAEGLLAVWLFAEIVGAVTTLWNIPWLTPDMVDKTFIVSLFLTDFPFVSKGLGTGSSVSE